MAGKIEDWWAGEYPSLSIKNYKRMNVYIHFSKHTKPFSKESPKFREAFWFDDNCDIYEWFDLIHKTGEKFGHDHNSDTYFYEYWWIIPKNIRRVRKVWFCDPIEWGVEITYYPEFDQIESWSVNNKDIFLESSKKYPSHNEGKRVGTVLTPEGPEEFSEEFWEDSEVIRTERIWKDSLGEEYSKVTEQRKGGKREDEGAKGGMVDKRLLEKLRRLAEESFKTLEELKKVCGGKDGLGVKDLGVNEMPVGNLKEFKEGNDKTGFGLIEDLQGPEKNGELANLKGGGSENDFKDLGKAQAGEKINSSNSDEFNTSLKDLSNPEQDTDSINPEKFNPSSDLTAEKTIQLFSSQKPAVKSTFEAVENLIEAEIEKQQKISELVKTQNLLRTLGGLEQDKLDLLQRLSEFTEEQDFKDLPNQITSLLNTLSSGFPDDPEQFLYDFNKTDYSLNTLLNEALQNLAKSEARKVEIFVSVNIEGGEILEGLQSIDSKTRVLLDANIFRVRMFDEAEAEKTAVLGKEINEISTDSPLNYIERISKRLDLLNDLENKSLDRQKVFGSLQKKYEEQENELKRLVEDWENEKRLLNELVSKLENDLKAKQEEFLTKDFELKNKEDELRDKEFELESLKSELENTKSLLDQKSIILDDALNTIHLQKCELTDKDSKINSLSTELNSKADDIQAFKESLQKLSADLKAKSEESDQNREESKRLAALAESQKVQLDTQKQLIEGSTDKNSELIQKLAEEAATNSKLLTDAQNDIEKLRKALDSSNSLAASLQSALDSSTIDLNTLQSSLSSLKSSYHKSQLRNILKIFRNTQMKLFKKWLDATLNKEKLVLGFSDDDIDSSDSEEERQLVQEYRAADELITEENRYLIENNIIMQNYKLIEGKTEKPMSYINIFKYLEELISSKYETDKKDIKDLRQMRSMTEFMMENLQRKFGIQSLALKFLSQFIPGFFQLYNEGQRYAVYYSRLLQLFHPEPVSYSLSLYLVRVAMEFNSLIEKCDRFMTNHKISVPVSNSSATYGRKAYEEASTGGFALVSDVIDYVYSLFAGDRDSGTKALEIMKPERVSVEEYVIFRICHKMAKLGSTPENIFNTLDKDGSGQISNRELVVGLKKDLDLWISEGNINKLMEQLDTDGNGDLSSAEFTERINMKIFTEWTKKPVWTITKCSFLTAMIEVYKYNQRKLAAHLNPTFLKYGKNEVDKEAFEEILLGYEPGLNVYDIEKLFSEGLETVPGSVGVNFKVLTLLMSKYGFGSLKSFKIRELMENLAIRKTTVDINLGVSEIGSQPRVKHSSSIITDSPMRTPSISSVERGKSPSGNRSGERQLTGKALKPEEESKHKKASSGLPPLPASIGESPSMIGKKKSTKK